jgi:hypothetical protein
MVVLFVGSGYECENYKLICNVTLRLVFDHIGDPRSNLFISVAISGQLFSVIAMLPG